MEQILHQLSLLSDKDRRHVEKELERERRHYEKELRRAERHRRREEKRRRRSERRTRGRHHSSSSSSSESESSDDERRYRPRQGLAYGLSTFGPGASIYPFMPPSAQGPPGFPPPPGPPSSVASPSTASTIQSRGSDHPQAVAPPPTYAPLAHHIQVQGDAAFPGQLVSGRPVAADVSGQAVYLGLVHLHGGLHPCKVIPHYNTPVYVGWAGKEHAPSGPYILVPFDDARMHWIYTRDGQVPPGVRPVTGGYEGDGQPLFHALCFVHGAWVPGKTGYHLEGANAPFAGEEHHAREYHLLCWK